MNEIAAGADADEMRSWLAARVARCAKLHPSEIDYDTPLSHYGLDSVSAVLIAVDIEDEYGVQLDVDTLWEFRTVNLLADVLTTL